MSCELLRDPVEPPGSSSAAMEEGDSMVTWCNNGLLKLNISRLAYVELSRTEDLEDLIFCSDPPSIHGLLPLQGSASRIGRTFQTAI